MSDLAISTIALVLCLAPALVHGVEVVRPLWARWVVNWVLPLFAPSLPRAAVRLTKDEQLAMLDAATGAVAPGKATAARDYVFLILFEQRQGALAFLAVAVGVGYGLTLPLDDRHALHLVFAVMAGLFALVNANHAGLRFLGTHPRISRNGRHVGMMFAPFWVLALVLNGMGFAASTGS